jgi:hypothetical protein
MNDDGFDSIRASTRSPGAATRFGARLLRVLR